MLNQRKKLIFRVRNRLKILTNLKKKITIINK